MKELLKKLHEVEPLADIKTLSKKINSYRTTFRQVYKKYNMSSEGDAIKDDVEEPTLWYYNILLPTVFGRGSARHKNSTQDDSFIYDRFNKVEESEVRPQPKDDHSFSETPVSYLGLL